MTHESQGLPVNDLLSASRQIGWTVLNLVSWTDMDKAKEHTRAAVQALSRAANRLQAVTEDDHDYIARSLVQQAAQTLEQRKGDRHAARAQEFLGMAEALLEAPRDEI